MRLKRVNGLKAKSLSLTCESHTFAFRRRMQISDGALPNRVLLILASGQSVYQEKNARWDPRSDTTKKPSKTDLGARLRDFLAWLRQSSRGKAARRATKRASDNEDVKKYIAAVSVRLLGQRGH